VLALAGVALAGCAGRPGDSRAADPPDPPAASGAPTAGCPTGAGVPLPGAFPRRLPVPGDATVTAVDHRSGHRLVVTTVTHHGFEAALTYLQLQLPQAGFALEEGEVEEHDAESNFVSDDVRGRWTLRAVPGCKGAVTLTYLTAPKSPG
jgi:hypothetical protein